MSSPAILGINFGSSYASIAIIGKEGHAECIANEEGERQIACAISYNGEEVYMGNGARPQLVKNSKNTIAGFRNLLGKKFAVAPSTTHSATLAPSAPVISTPGEVPGYQVSILVPPPKPVKGAKSVRGTPAASAAASGTATPLPEPTAQELVLSVPEVTTLFLKSLLQSATDFLGSKPDDGCVIAAPSHFGPEQREALTKAAEAAGINVLQIMDESAAVLVGYRAGLPAERSERGFAPEGEDEKADKVVVVVDVGETGVEVEVVAVREGAYVHLGGARDTSVGGRELDRVLISHFSKEFTKKNKVPLTLPVDAATASEADLRAQTKLLLAIEHTKRSLSASTGAATCAVESLKDGYDLSASINRARFNMIASPVFSKITKQVKTVVESTGKNLAQVDEILLAGSSSLLTGLSEALQNLFPEDSPVPISSSLDPSQAIAIGCALQAFHLASLPASKTGTIPISTLLESSTSSIPTTAKPIGLVLPGSTDFIVVVPEATPLPARRIVALPVADGVSEVGVELWEGEESIRFEKAPKVVYSDDEDDEDFEPEEPEDIAVVEKKATAFLTAVKVGVKAKKAGKVVLEITVEGTGVQVQAYEEGSSDKVTAKSA